MCFFVRKISFVVKDMTLYLKQIRVLGFCFGGLDSMLVGLVLREQGIDVVWVIFEMFFFMVEKVCYVSCIIGILLMVKSIFVEYIIMLWDFNCGYGKNMNLCFDCYVLMFCLVGEMMW